MHDKNNKTEGEERWRVGWEKIDGEKKSKSEIKNLERLLLQKEGEYRE